MSKTSPILTDEERQKIEQALADDARARQEIQDANAAAIKQSLASITGLASFNTLLTKLDEVVKMDGFHNTPYAAHVNGLQVTARHLADSVK